MSLPIDEPLIAEFRGLLDGPPESGRQKEQQVQDFMEEHSELIPTIGLLHHNLQFKCVLSKFPLGTAEIPDWVMLSKSTNQWLCTIIELKQPSAKIFGADASSSEASRDFEKALNQVRDNKLYVGRHGAEIRDRLESLIQPVNMKRNPLKFSHQLIYGRNAERDLSEARRETFRSRAEELDCELLTFDTVINSYSRNMRFKKNILRLSGTQFAFKRLVDPDRMFAFMSPGELALSPTDEAALKHEGYQIEEWKSGKFLNGDIFAKTVAQPMNVVVDEIMSQFRLDTALKSAGGKKPT